MPRKKEGASKDCKNKKQKKITQVEEGYKELYEKKTISLTKEELEKILESTYRKGIL